MMTKWRWKWKWEDEQNFESRAKCWICENNIVKNDVKVRDHCHFAGKCAVAAHKDYNVNVIQNYKIPVVFHNVKHHDGRFIKLELGKFDFKVNLIPNILERYMSYETYFLMISYCSLIAFNF